MLQFIYKSRSKKTPSLSLTIGEGAYCYDFITKTAVDHPIYVLNKTDLFLIEKEFKEHGYLKDGLKQ